MILKTSDETVFMLSCYSLVVFCFCFCFVLFFLQFSFLMVSCRVDQRVHIECIR